MAATKLPEVLLSELLTLHLDRAIKRYKEPDLTMSKILEAARLVAERKRQWDERAQAVIDAMPALESKANQAFERPEALMAATEQEFKDLHKVFDDALLMSNNPKNDDGKKEAAGSEGSSSSFPRAHTTTVSS